MWQPQNLRILLIVLIMAQVDAGPDNVHAAQCGGELKGPAGIIHTPRFPKPFKVPIKCKWIINNSHINGSISVYFSQLFTTSGITFTEYWYYDESFRAGERKVLTITDENVTKIKFVKVTSPFLVIDFMLDSIEGTQLRALDLLDMFGFNMTYVVKAAVPKTTTIDPIHYNETAMPPYYDTEEYVPTEEDTACSVVECSLLGHCYARPDYSAFYCACFDGFEGKDCSIGHLCPSLRDICQNGGTCKQLGRAAVTCQCPPSYTGELCETALRPTECSFMECCVNSKDCGCDERPNDMDGTRYDVTLRTAERISPDKYPEIISELSSYMNRSNITLRGNISIIPNAKRQGAESQSLSVRLLGAAQASGAVRAALAKLVAHARLEKVLLQPTTLDFEASPMLYLQDLTAGASDRVGVWKGADFSLSCIIRGSADTVFQWYKDGHRVNIQKATRDTWQHTVVEESAGRRIALLGARYAVRAHAGTWSCVAKDSASRQCRATQLRVLEPPALTVSPRAITLRKGQSTTVTCLAEAASRTHGALGFSWARGKSLLPLSPGSEEWEDLYPAGSLLKLYNVTKSSEYQCQMTSTTGTSRQAVQVWVVEQDACQPGATHGVNFHLTAPGSIAYAECPNGFVGQVKRTCEATTGSNSAHWLVPDFTDCFWQPLLEEYNEFMKLTYGLASRDMLEIIANYGVKIKSARFVMPGSGTLLLQQGVEMLEYLQALPRGEQQADAAYMLATVFDGMLNHKDVFLDEEKVHEYVRAVLRLATFTRNCTKNRPLECGLDKNKIIESCTIKGDHFSFFTFQTNGTTGCKRLHFLSEPAQRHWRPYAIQNMSPHFVRGTAVYFHSINENLPSLEKPIKYHNRIIKLLTEQVTLVPADPLDEVNVSVTWLSSELTGVAYGDATDMLCGIRIQDKPYVWNFEPCTHLYRASDVIGVEGWTCNCYVSGIIGLFGSPLRSVPVNVLELCIVYTTLKLYLIVLGFCLFVQLHLRILYGASDQNIYDTRIFYCIQQMIFPGLLIFQNHGDDCGSSVIAHRTLKDWAWLIQCNCVLGIFVSVIQPFIIDMEIKKTRDTRYLCLVLIVGIWSTVWIAAVDMDNPFSTTTPQEGALVASMLLYVLVGMGWGIWDASKLRRMISAASTQDAKSLRRRMHWVCGYMASVLAVSFVNLGSMAVISHTYAINYYCSYMVFIIFLQIITLGCEIGMWDKIAESRPWYLLLCVRRQGAQPQSNKSHKRKNRKDDDDELVNVDAVYWRAPQPGSPIHYEGDNNTQEDCRADIVKSAEVRTMMIIGPPQLFDSYLAQEVRPDPLDLIPDPVPVPASESGHPPSSMRMTSELLKTKSPIVRIRIINIPSDNEPVPDVHIVSTSSTNSKSTPDISEQGLPQKVPIKSCLKRTNPPDLSKSLDDHSRSLPSILFLDPINERPQMKDIHNVNSNTDTGNNVLKKISNDLAFLLNKTPDLLHQRAPESEMPDQETMVAF